MRREARWAEELTGLTGQRLRAMEFLRDHLPASDLESCPFPLFLDFADHALALREAAPWCGELEWELFAHYVLFPRVNDEDLSPHRALFHAQLWPRAAPLPSSEERVLEVNRWCCEHASYQAQDQRTASPLTVYRCGSGRCGEESAFLVAALRSVGIAARQVYAPRWAHCDDNHAWVEALCGGAWRFLGACEPEPVLDRGWFNTAASRAVLVHSRLFGPGDSPLHGQPLGREGMVTWYNQTSRYAPVQERVFQARLDGRPAAGAVFHLQLLNEAGFHTIASLTAGRDGRARAALGLGDIHVLAELDGRWAEGDCGPQGITLDLTSAPRENAQWTQFDFRAPAPAEGRAPPLTAEQKAQRADALARCAALRQARLAAQFDPARAGALPGCGDLLQKARGNFDELFTFLSRDGDPRREALVRTLWDKDLRDVTAAVLEDHLSRLPPPPAGTPEAVYWRYLACPRVALEPLTPWRGALQNLLPRGLTTPDALVPWLERRVAAGGDAEGYAPLWLPPLAALEAGRCGRKSFDLLLVAALRTLGVPARLRPLDGAPELWQNGAFHPLRPEETGTLRLTCPGGPPVCGRDWTLSRWTGAGWQLLTPPGGDWQNGGLTLTLPAGRYRLLTSTRLLNGDQLAARREVEVSPGAPAQAELRLRPFDLARALSAHSMPPTPAAAPDGSTVDDLFRLNDRPSLLVWAEEGAEPTEHLLGELEGQRAALDALGVNPVFLVRSREALDQPTLARTLRGWPSARVLLDDWAYDLEDFARRLSCDPDTPPLAVVCDGAGRAACAASGYRVGGAALLAQAAACLCRDSPHQKGTAP